MKFIIIFWVSDLFEGKKEYEKEENHALQDFPLSNLDIRVPYGNCNIKKKKRSRVKSPLGDFGLVNRCRFEQQWKNKLISSSSNA